MAKLEDALARLGTAWLSDALGEATLLLLDELDFRNLTPGRLAGLLVSLKGAEGLLLDKSTRQALVEAQCREDAERLARFVLMDDPANPWEAIVQTSFRRNSASTRMLFSFFGCEPPTELEPLPDTEQALPSQYSLFAHQRKACREVIQALENEPRRVLLHMPTGAGKTRTAMNVIVTHLRRRENTVVVWLAHSEELCEQAAQEFGQAWSILGDREVTLHRHFASHATSLANIEDGVVIGGLQKLYSQSLSKQSEFLQLARRTSLVVMDEAHQAIAPTYNHLLNLLAPTQNTALLGLSATPGRSLLDVEEDLRLAEFFQHQKVTLTVEGYNNPVHYLQAAGYLAQTKYHYIHFTPPDGDQLTPKEIRELELGLDLPQSVIKRLAANHVRNFQILSQTVQEIEQGNKILLFACSVEHAELLANLLRAKGHHARAITSKTPDSERRSAIDEYKNGDDIQVLTNFGVLTTGFDAPRTNVAIITRPTRSVVLYSQMVGRASRGPKAGGNQSCKIITVVDRIPGFRSVAEAFSFWDDIWESKTEP